MQFEGAPRCAQFPPFSVSPQLSILWSLRAPEFETPRRAGLRVRCTGLFSRLLWPWVPGQAHPLTHGPPSPIPDPPRLPQTRHSFPAFSTPESLQGSLQCCLLWEAVPDCPRWKTGLPLLDSPAYSKYQGIVKVAGVLLLCSAYSVDTKH